MEQLQKGDYVIATKYDDGDPKDHFAVGFFDSMTWHNRYNIVTSEGELFRGNGFRKAKKISQEVGAKIVSHIKDIEQNDKSVWEWVSEFEKR
ncbi:MAG TPA: hypothetical protein VFL47_02215 [Flavisolibacter sp.]|nr:hypothetical protein [Flavisolibacter sp.]